jgi:hypothetical protein
MTKRKAANRDLLAQFASVNPNANDILYILNPLRTFFYNHQSLWDFPPPDTHCFIGMLHLVKGGKGGFKLSQEFFFQFAE